MATANVIDATDDVDVTPNVVKEASFFMKVVVIGDSGVGKTSILRSYIENASIDEYDKNYKATIGSDLYLTNLRVQENTAQLQVWDTAGQERFNSMSKQLYRGADILILVYDITNKESFTNIEHWKNNFISSLSDDHPQPFPTLLLGNKSDLVEAQIGYRKVERDKAQIYADGHDMVFYECSALTKINIHAGFADISLIAMNKVAVPLVYKMDHAFCLPADYHKQEKIELEERKNNNNSNCYCQLL